MFVPAARVHALCVARHFVAHALLRSNKRDASLIISKRLTRIGKLAGSLGVKPSDDAEIGGDEAADAAEVAEVAEVAGGQVMRHGHASVMSVAQLVADVLPDGAQYIGACTWSLLFACVDVGAFPLALLTIRASRQVAPTFRTSGSSCASFDARWWTTTPR